MKDSFSTKCSHCCQGLHSFSRSQIEGTIWYDMRIDRKRPYGNEVIHMGKLKVDCEANPRDIECYVYEYPKGSARVQEILDGGDRVTDEVSISYSIPLSRTVSLQHPYGTIFPNRDNGNYFILDSLVIGQAVKLDNDMIWLLQIPIPDSFPLEPLSDMTNTNKKQQYLPATVCCCMNAESRRFSFGKSRKLPKKIAGVLRNELDKMGFDPNVEKLSTKSMCSYYVGHCSEVNAANKVLLKKRTDLSNLVFSIAVRPRTMQIIEPCMNCATIFPTL